MGFEAKLAQAALLKKLIDSIKDLVSDANWECSGTGINLQAMDTSHVSLVQLVLKSDGFANFHCDRNLALGLNMGNMAKILKCATNEDSITIKADDNGDAVTFVFESEKKDKHSVFDLKLSNIDAENLGIPETDYSVTIQMPSGEFQKICKDLQQIGDTVTISATKSGVKFTASGDIGTGSVQLRQNAAADKKEDAVIIDMSEPVTLTFALKYLNMFTKSTSLSDKVIISMSKESPLLVNYNIGEMGHIKFYLAPKVDDGEEQAPEAAEKAPKEEVEDDE